MLNQTHPSDCTAIHHQPLGVPQVRASARTWVYKIGRSPSLFSVRAAALSQVDFAYARDAGIVNSTSAPQSS
jgi:hypothetical protein